MSVTPNTGTWSNEAGYEYYCFVSWAHTKNREMTECARKVKQQIEGVNQRVEAIAEELVKRNSIADCEDYTLPTVSAFDDYHGRSEFFPFRNR